MGKACVQSPNSSHIFSAAGWCCFFFSCSGAAGVDVKLTSLTPTPSPTPSSAVFSKTPCESYCNGIVANVREKRKTLGAAARVALPVRFGEGGSSIFPLLIFIFFFLRDFCSSSLILLSARARTRSATRRLRTAFRRARP